mgnify:CR=1 FL=1
MIIPGIVSVTFRKNTADEIIKMAEDASLKAIEWGADVHATTGDIGNATKLGKLTRAAGLLPISFGSYYWIGFEGEHSDFTDVLDTAVALGTKNIRSWAGRKASADVSEEKFRQIADEIAKKCDEAALRGMTLSLEYHPNTLTDNKKSAVRLARMVNKPNLRLYWQPDFTLSDTENLLSLEAVLPWLGNVHVFSWLGAGAARYPLAHSRELFCSCADMIKSDGRDHGMLLEFVKGDDPHQMSEDAETLLDIIGR